MTLFLDTPTLTYTPADPNLSLTREQTQRLVALRTATDAVEVLANSGTKVNRSDIQELADWLYRDDFGGCDEERVELLANSLLDSLGLGELNLEDVADAVGDADAEEDDMNELVLVKVGAENYATLYQYAPGPRGAEQITALFDYDHEATTGDWRVLNQYAIEQMGEFRPVEDELVLIHEDNIMSLSRYAASPSDLLDYDHEASRHDWRVLNQEGLDLLGDFHPADAEDGK